MHFFIDDDGSFCLMDIGILNRNFEIEPGKNQALGVIKGKGLNL